MANSTARKKLTATFRQKGQPPFGRPQALASTPTLCYYTAPMPTDPYHGLFTRHMADEPWLTTATATPGTLTDPTTGQPLRIATVEVSGAICPACRRKGTGGFVSFVADLRLVFACPHCGDMIWIAGA